MELGEVPQMATGGIAMHDLDEKHLGGGHGVETSLAPRITDIVADLQDGVRCTLGGPILLELFHHLGEGRSYG